MKMILLTLLIIFLSGCKDYPKIADQEQLSPIFIYLEDGSIDSYNSYCLSKIYRINKGFIIGNQFAIGYFFTVFLPCSDIDLTTFTFIDLSNLSKAVLKPRKEGHIHIQMMPDGLYQ